MGAGCMAEPDQDQDLLAQGLETTTYVTQCLNKVVPCEHWPH